jgi:hypothetical protein
MGISGIRMNVYLHAKRTHFPRHGHGAAVHAAAKISWSAGEMEDKNGTTSGRSEESVVFYAGLM